MEGVWKRDVFHRPGVVRRHLQVGWPSDEVHGGAGDQDPEAEFEELMAATGQTAAFVDLRQANEHARWLGGSFVARPLGHISTRAVWSHHFDAFLFLRTQEVSEAR